MRRDGRLAGYLLRVRKSFEGWKNRFAFEFEIHEGFGRSFGWISPRPLYTRKRGRQLFLTLPFVSALPSAFCHLRLPSASSPLLPPLPFGDG
jgi:hypothetical protein